MLVWFFGLNSILVLDLDPLGEARNKEKDLSVAIKFEDNQGKNTPLVSASTRTAQLFPKGPKTKLKASTENHADASQYRHPT